MVKELDDLKLISVEARFGQVVVKMPDVWIAQCCVNVCSTLIILWTCVLVDEVSSTNSSHMTVTEW